MYIVELQFRVYKCVRYVRQGLVILESHVHAFNGWESSRASLTVRQLSTASAAILVLIDTHSAANDHGHQEQLINKLVLLPVVPELYVAYRRVSGRR